MKNIFTFDEIDDFLQKIFDITWPDKLVYDVKKDSYRKAKYVDFTSESTALLYLRSRKFVSYLTRAKIGARTFIIDDGRGRADLSQEWMRYRKAKTQIEADEGVAV